MSSPHSSLTRMPVAYSSSMIAVSRQASAAACGSSASAAAPGAAGEDRGHLVLAQHLRKAARGLRRAEQRPGIAASQPRGGPRR